MNYIDCPTCGQTEHESKFRTCGRCEQYICQWCRDNTHECHDPFDKEVCPISGELSCGDCPNIDECAGNESIDIDGDERGDLE